MKLKLLSTALLLVLASSCAFNSGDSDENKAYNDTREKLESEFAQIGRAHV